MPSSLQRIFRLGVLALNIDRAPILLAFSVRIFSCLADP
jgi:hypothetical protein